MVFKSSVAASAEQHDGLKRLAGSANRAEADRARAILLSALIKCACCGGGYAMISADLVGCSTARNKGTCDNRRNIRHDRLEGRVLNALRCHLMNPDLFKEL